MILHFRNAVVKEATYRVQALPVRYQVFGLPLAARLAPRYASNVNIGQTRSLTAANH